MRKRTVITGTIVIAVVAFLAWRFIRPMNIFVVSEVFERPIDTTAAPAVLGNLRATECGACHQSFYNEWKTTIHSQAWTDPYFQADWKFDGSQQVCKNCHIPLDRQQEHRVLGFRDKEKWEPILEDNPDFNPRLQHEGVTCAACHVRDGKVVGVHGIADAPHPVRKLGNPNQVCVRCHVVSGERWDAWWRFPPCGTVAEIRETPGAQLNEQEVEALLKLEPDRKPTGASGEIRVPDSDELNCVQCHMPAVKRPLVEGGEPRLARRHLWRGGHDPAMVRATLDINLAEEKPTATGKRVFALTLTNTGAAHYLPTGTPDRHLTVDLTLRDHNGVVLKREQAILKRTVMWRPLIIDLWDTRLPRWQPRRYRIGFSTGDKPAPAAVEAVVRYHLLEEKRRRRIGYENSEPISYEVYRERMVIGE